MKDNTPSVKSRFDMFEAAFSMILIASIDKYLPKI